MLAAVAGVRAEKGLVCAVDSRPATGCGGEVKEVSPEAKAADTPVQLRSGHPERGRQREWRGPSKGQRF